MRTGIVVTALCLAVVGAAAAEEAIAPTGKIELFNGKNLDGWKAFSKNENAPSPWSVKDGVIDCTGVPPGYIKTEKTYKNYQLHVEWRWSGTPGNSGVLLHMNGEDRVWPRSIEAQLMNRNAGDFFVIEGTEFKEHIAVNARSDKATRRTPKMGETAENDVGEWNNYDIVCDGDSILVTVNGKLKNKATECTVTSGRICLQSEGKPIQFRNVYLEPLD